MAKRRLVCRCSELALDDLEQLPLVDRLGDEDPSADRPPRSSELLLRYRGGEEHDRNFPQLLVGPKTRRHFSTVRVGHDDVEEDQVGLELAGGRDRLQTFVLDPYLVLSTLFEVELEQAGERLFVIDQQQSLERHL